MVYAAEDIRLERAMKRDSATEAQIRARMKAQISDEEKCRKSDYVIHNGGSLSLENQLSALVGQLKKSK
jgi:dephospho-CoA kinase